MPAPSKTNLLTLDFYQNGQPFCNVLAGNAGSNATDFYQNAQPFYAVGSTAITIVSVSGVQGTFILNLVNVWGNIIPVPTSPWSPVDDSQTENWVIIDKAAG